MEMPEGKQRQPNADLYEAALWYLRSKAKDLPTEEMQEFASWLRRSPENASALLRIAEVEGCVIPHRRAGRVKQILARALGLEIAISQAMSKHRALSLSYYKHVRQKSRYPKIGLLVVALCGVGAWMFLGDTRPAKIAAVAIACFVLLMIREAVVRFRVEQGYFGSTESEVRDFVRYVVARRTDINFTDQGGKRRPSLVPEPRPDSATPASTGVLSE